ncbi:MAG: hypothetical protein ACFE0O_05885 [Opitutales bacterium]
MNNWKTLILGTTDPWALLPVRIGLGLMGVALLIGGADNLSFDRTLVSKKE